MNRDAQPSFRSLSALAQAPCPGRFVLSCEGEACCQLVESQERVIKMKGAGGQGGGQHGVGSLSGSLATKRSQHPGTTSS